MAAVMVAGEMHMANVEFNTSQWLESFSIKKTGRRENIKNAWIQVI